MGGAISLSDVLLEAGRFVSSSTSICSTSERTSLGEDDPLLIFYNYRKCSA